MQTFSTMHVAQNICYSQGYSANKRAAGNVLKKLANLKQLQTHFTVKLENGVGLHPWLQCFTQTSMSVCEHIWEL